MSLRKLAEGAINSSVVPLVRFTHSMAFAERSAREAQSAIRREMDELRAHVAKDQPDNPCLKGLKVYSQVDEDGIIQEIFRRMPSHSRTFIEIGCGDGLENNTHFLALLGYRGIWIDADHVSLERLAQKLGGLSFPTLTATQMFVSCANAKSVADMAATLGSADLGLLSIDIDGNDLHVLVELLKHIKPQVLCVEYNAKFPPPISVCVRYSENVRWENDDYQGASLQAYCDALADYKLVCCSLAGANAFFVRRDLAENFADRMPAELYQPLRYNLAGWRPHHPPSLKWLRDRLEPAAAS